MVFLVVLVTMKNQSLIKLAKNEAEKSEHKFRVGAVIFDGKRIISRGHNHANAWSSKLHPRFKKWNTSIHAEAMAILNARRRLKGKSIVVVRINRNGDYMLALPCEHCMSYLQYVGIKNIMYSINEEPYFEEVEL
jgi:deoxycytidylate deaminase